MAESAARWLALLYAAIHNTSGGAYVHVFECKKCVNCVVFVWGCVHVW